MTSASSIQVVLADGMRALSRWLRNWWRIVLLGAQLMSLALWPSTYTPAYRQALLRHVYLGTAPSLVWFTVLTTLLSLVVIRIVIVTSVSYGLTQYALEMVVRVLVLELIPLTAALFAALRCTIPQAADVGALRARDPGNWDAPQRGAGEPMRMEVLPRVTAGLVCALLLAFISCGVTLVLAYVSVYGFNTAGFPAYTRTVGHVFSPGIALVFGLKIVAMAIAVALLPVTSILIEPARSRSGTSAELRGLVRMFFAILLIEGAALVGNYY
jgi:phospholipid/cholesterol/gamma-HCH transport system permease protein